MAHRLRILAVQHQTSVASQTEHQVGPNIQLPVSCSDAEKGNTRIPTIRSAAAREPMNRCVVVRRVGDVATAAITRPFPVTTTVFSRARASTEDTASGSDQSTPVQSAVAATDVITAMTDRRRIGGRTAR